MTPQDLIAIGEYLYGSAWVGRIARDLGIAERTINRFKSGTHPINTGVADEIYCLVAKDLGLQLMSTIVPSHLEGKSIKLSPYSQWSPEAEDGIKNSLVKFLCETGIKAELA